MVTTSSLGQNLDFKPCNLKPDEYPEDGQIINALALTLEGLVNSLKPILKYIDGITRGVRGVEVVKDGPYMLILTRNGEFIELDTVGGGRTPGDFHWKNYLVSDTIKGLQQALEEATKKREEHLAAVESRKAMLDQMVAVMNKADGQAETQS